MNETPHRKPRSLFWEVFVLTILLLALLSGYAALRELRQLADARLAATDSTSERAIPPPAITLIKVVLHGRSHHLPPHQATLLGAQLAAQLAAEEEVLQQRMADLIDQQLAAVFDPLHARVPAFADWYYSLSGDYSRIAAAVRGDLLELFSEQLTRLVIAPSAIEAQLNQLQQGLNGELATALQASNQQLVSELERVARRYQPLVEEAQPPEGEEPINLDAWLAESFALSPLEVGQKATTALAAAGVGGVAAKGLGGVVAKQLVAELVATKGVQGAAALLAQVAAKGAAKGGGSLAAGAGGAALCSPGGPLALVCGITAAALTWVTFDLAFIELKQYLDRDEFEADLHAAIARSQEQLHAELLLAYQQTVAAHYQILYSGLLQLSSEGSSRATLIPAQQGL